MKIQELLPHLKKGWVAMDEHKRWWYARTKLKPIKELGIWITYHPYSDASCLSEVYDIEPFDGDWKDSLMECGKCK